MHSILLASQKVTGRFRRDGFAVSLRYLVRRAKQFAHHIFYDAKYDRLEKYSSGEQRWVSSGEVVGRFDAARVNYDAYPRLPLLWALQGLNLDPREFSFLDFGSGRGRIVLTAASLPFRQCIGVEFSRVLHAEALINVSGYPAKQLVCRNNILVNADARDFKLPEGNLVAFFFNPFLGAILDRVAQNIEAAARDSRRTIYVIFANTTGADLFPGRESFRRIHPRGIARLKLALFGTIPLEFYRVDAKPSAH